MPGLNHAISLILMAQMSSPSTTATPNTFDATQVAVEPTKLGREEILGRLTKLASPDGPAIRLLTVDMSAECTLNFVMEDGHRATYQVPCMDEQLLRQLAMRAMKFLPEDLGARLRQPHG